MITPTLYSTRFPFPYTNFTTHCHTHYTNTPLYNTHTFLTTAALHWLALHCRWCVEAPFFEQTSDSPEPLPQKTKLLKTETELDKATIGSTPSSSSSPPPPSSSASSPPASFKPPPSSETMADLYSQLHLSILQTLQNVPSVRARMTQKQASMRKHRSGVNSPCSTYFLES